MLAALAAHVLPAALLFSRRLETAIGPLRVRLALVAIYLLLPYPGETWLNLTNAHWRLALSAFLLILAAPPQGPLERTADILVHLVTGLSGLHVAFLWVCSALHAAFDRGRWSRVVLGVYTMALGLQAIAMTAGVGGRDLGALGAEPSVLVRIVGGQVSIGAFGGTRGVLWAHARPAGALAALAAFLVLCLVLAHALRSGPPALRLYIVFGTLVVAGALATPMVQPGVDQWARLQIPPAGSRYWLHLRAAMIVAITWGAVLGKGRAIRAVYRILAVIVLAAAIGDFRLPPLPDTGFLEAAASFESMRSGSELVIPINPPGWEMRLSKR